MYRSQSFNRGRYRPFWLFQNKRSSITEYRSINANCRVVRKGGLDFFKVKFVFLLDNFTNSIDDIDAK